MRVHVGVAFLSLPNVSFTKACSREPWYLLYGTPTVLSRQVHALTNRHKQQSHEQHAVLDPRGKVVCHNFGTALGLGLRLSLCGLLNG